MPKNNDFIFSTAWQARDELSKRQLKEIRKIYNDWAKDIKEKAKQLQAKGNIEEARKATELYYQIRTTSKQISAEINNTIKNGVQDMGDIVARVNQRWINSLGFTNESINTKFSPAKDLAIRNILTGNMYENGASLSDRVWKITDSNLKDIYGIISRGIAENTPIAEIAKQLEKYVNPSARLPWTVGQYTQNGVNKRIIIHNKKVDYNALRLARTMLQHAYQQSLVALTKDNPFVKGYIWHADGGHPCEVCEARDGQFYTAESMPLDHPNGMCSFEVDIDYDKAANNLSEWFKNPILYPDIERWAGNMVYKP